VREIRAPIGRLRLLAWRRESGKHGADVCAEVRFRWANVRGSRDLEIVVTDVDSEIAAMPFEKALAELEGIVDQLEKGAVSLDDSVRLYERGEALKRHCDELLKNVEMRIEKITLAADGKPKGLTPLDGD
jgi:exodeoxyribonuclease VII small subunit